MSPPKAFEYFDGGQRSIIMDLFELQLELRSGKKIYIGCLKQKNTNSLLTVFSLVFAPCFPALLDTTGDDHEFDNDHKYCSKHDGHNDHPGNGAFLLHFILRG